MTALARLPADLLEALDGITSMGVITGAGVSAESANHSKTKQ